MSFISCTPSRLGGWWFHLLHRNHHRVKQNKEAKEYVPNKALGKTSAKNLNKMEIRHILIKMSKVKYKEKILKAARKSNQL